MKFRSAAPWVPDAMAAGYLGRPTISALQQPPEGRYPPRNEDLESLSARAAAQEKNVAELAAQRIASRLDGHRGGSRR